MPEAIGANRGAAIVCPAAQFAKRSHAPPNRVTRRRACRAAPHLGKTNEPARENVMADKAITKEGGARRANGVPEPRTYALHLPKAFRLTGSGSAESLKHTGRA